MIRDAEPEEEEEEGREHTSVPETYPDTCEKRMPEDTMHRTNRQNRTRTRAYSVVDQHSPVSH